MGGSGSGRWQRRGYTVEDALTLSARAVKPDDSSTLVPILQDGALVALMRVKVLPHFFPSAHRVVIGWRERLNAEDPYQPHVQELRLESRRQPFGGVRWRWQCPRCKRLRMALHKLAGSRWACRECLGLTYASRRADGMHRATLRLHKLARRLHVPAGTPLGWGDPMPDKPRGMRWHSYDRIAEEWDAVNARGTVAFLQFGKRLGVPAAEIFGAHAN